MTCVYASMSDWSCKTPVWIFERYEFDARLFDFGSSISSLNQRNEYFDKIRRKIFYQWFKSWNQNQIRLKGHLNIWLAHLNKSRLINKTNCGWKRKGKCCLTKWKWKCISPHECAAQNKDIFQNTRVIVLRK